jgi:hypothetical protein
MLWSYKHHTVISSKSCLVTCLVDLLLISMMSTFLVWRIFPDLFLWMDPPWMELFTCQCWSRSDFVIRGYTFWTSALRFHPWMPLGFPGGCHMVLVIYLYLTCQTGPHTATSSTLISLLHQGGHIGKDLRSRRYALYQEHHQLVPLSSISLPPFGGIK